MLPEPMKPASTLPEEEKHKQFDREIREMISALTHRLADLQHVKKPDSSHHGTDEDGHGVHIITLAGTNTGATMRSELDDKPQDQGDINEALGTYVNSNFQAINNSLVMGGSYKTNDPGVHLDITDYDVEHHEHDRHGKKKKKEKETTKSEHHYGDSD